MKKNISKKLRVFGSFMLLISIMFSPFRDILGWDPLISFMVQGVFLGMGIGTFVSWLLILNDVNDRS